MYADIVNDSLTEFAYDADLAGLTYNLFGHSTGIYVSMSGYNDRLVVLAQQILERIKNLKVDEQKLAAMKEQVWPSQLF